MSGLESAMGLKFDPLTGKWSFLPFGAHNVTLNLEISCEDNYECVAGHVA